MYTMSLTGLDQVYNVFALRIIVFVTTVVGSIDVLAHAISGERENVEH